MNARIATAFCALPPRAKAPTETATIAARRTGVAKVCAWISRSAMRCLGTDQEKRRRNRKRNADCAKQGKHDRVALEKHYEREVAEEDNDAPDTSPTIRRC
jgi:hypothetical protein